MEAIATSSKNATSSSASLSSLPVELVATRRAEVPFAEPELSRRSKEGDAEGVRRPAWRPITWQSVKNRGRYCGNRKIWDYITTASFPRILFRPILADARSFASDVLGRVLQHEERKTSATNTVNASVRLMMRVMRLASLGSTFRIPPKPHM